MSDDILDYANRLDCVLTIERATTYDTRLERLWRTLPRESRTHETPPRTA